MNEFELRKRSWIEHSLAEEEINPFTGLTGRQMAERFLPRVKLWLNLMLADMALNSYRGFSASTHGRSYRNNKMFTHANQRLQWAVFFLGVSASKKGISVPFP